MSLPGDLKFTKPRIGWRTTYLHDYIPFTCAYEIHPRKDSGDSLTKSPRGRNMQGKSGGRVFKSEPSARVLGPRHYFFGIRLRLQFRKEKLKTGAGSAVVGRSLNRDCTAMLVKYSSCNPHAEARAFLSHCALHRRQHHSASSSQASAGITWLSGTHRRFRPGRH